MAPTSGNQMARRGTDSFSPPLGLPKPKSIERHFIGSPATSHEPSSSSSSPPRSAVKVTPPPSSGFARAAQTTPPPPPINFDQPAPQVVFQGDPAAWYAMLQAQWQICDAYKLAGQVQLEAQQREYAMSFAVSV